MSDTVSFAHEPPADHAELMARVRFSLDEPIRMTEEELAQRATEVDELHAFTRATSVRVTARLMPKVHAAIERACTNLLLTHEPEVYIDRDPSPNAGAISHGERYLITLSSGLVPLLTPPELTAVVGHELGHASMRHMMKGDESEKEAPFMYERKRAQEISADRVALIAADDPIHALRASIKITCGLGFEHLTSDIDAFIEQISTPPADIDAFWEEEDTHPGMALRFWAQRLFMESDVFAGIKGLSGGRSGGRSFDEIERETEERFHGAGSSAVFRATADHVHESLAWLGILAVAGDGQLSDKEHEALRDIVGRIWADDAFAYAKRHGLAAVERRAKETLAPLRFSSLRTRRRIELALREFTERANSGPRLQHLLQLLEDALPR